MIFSAPTEIWQLQNGESKIVNPILITGNYIYGIGLFAVDFNFCKKWFRVPKLLEINWNDKYCLKLLVEIEF